MTETATASLEDARPLVARRVSNRGVWLFAGATGLAAVLLFSALEARRADRTDRELNPARIQDGAMIEPPPPLAVPDTVPPETAYPQSAAPWPVRVISVPGTSMETAYPRQARRNAATPTYQPQVAPPYYRPAAIASPSGPALVYQAPPAAASANAASDDTQRSSLQRVMAGRFERPATTIPQGSVIQAVLETALDSTRAGAARAIVSRDVRGFDGTKVLIPRGSRLYGEYKSDVSSGQNRAMIQWTRLMRPDGVSIQLDSPSADPLGRAGVPGKVNSHFLARFGGALLQSTLNLGVSLAGRSVGGDTLVLGLPGSSQTIAPASSESVKPTLRVAQGSPVSVFVARDLDFTEVER